MMESNKVRIMPDYHRTKHYDAWHRTITGPILRGMLGQASLKDALAQATEAGDKALATGEVRSV